MVQDEDEVKTFFLRNLICTVLIAGGTIGGVTAASREPIQTLLFIISVALMLLGILVKKFWRIDTKDAAAGDGFHSDGAVPSVTQIKSDLHAIREELDGEEPLQQDTLRLLVSSLTQNVFDLHASVDGLRGALGAGHVAQITALISEAERHINRSWSAICDGHEEEARRSLEAADERFDEAFLMISEKTGDRRD